MTDKAISPLRRRLIEDMEIRRLSPKTQYQYIRHVKKFADFLGRSADKATAEDVHRYQLWLASSGTSVGTANVSATALRFFFKVTGVDPVRWTPFHLRRRCHRCRRVTDPIRRNSGDRWLIWSDVGEPRRSCRVSSSRPPRRSGTGFVRPIAMKAADRTARPALSARN